MPFSQWFRPPRHVLTVFLCLMCVFGGAMGWFGWQLLQQERSLERQRVQERLEQAADHMAATLQRSLSELETYLGFIPGPGVKQPPEGVALLRATERTITVYPPARLLYYPATPGGQEPSSAAFIEGEKLEFQQNDPGKAAEAF